ncbi:tRNA (adenosine(37)-N6)-dimethylallyltransferase MiaA [Myxococcota bacterium]|nr:tRNA (adenosine(37)-N6)-dimethylallyltransferase MiaA [Myxococcota bacterium]
MDKTNKIIAVVGPTASGKTSFSMELCRRLGGEIISCDSVQVYRGFNIGSAKATRDEQAQIPHHLLDVAEWSESFDAQRYSELAKEAIADIRARGKVPILTGGTGLYLRTLRWGLMDAPKIPEELREKLRKDEDANPGQGWQRLFELDPLSAEKIEKNNTHYVLRALELCLVSGRKASELRAEHGFSREEVPMDVISLLWERDVLRKRIFERTGEMLQGGMIEECEALLASGVSPDCRPMTAVGYREVVAYLKGDLARDQLLEAIATRTWQYSKRQRTWFRREKDTRDLEFKTIIDFEAALTGAFGSLLSGSPAINKTLATDSPE